MACCLMASSHYLNQCWLIINEVCRNSFDGNFAGNAQDIYPWYAFDKYQFKISAMINDEHTLGTLLKTKFQIMCVCVFFMMWALILTQSNITRHCKYHYNDVIMNTMASQITSLMIVYSGVVYSATDQRKYQSSGSLAFVRGIHRGPMNSPYKRPVMWKMSPFDDIIMLYQWQRWSQHKPLTHWGRVTHICVDKLTIIGSDNGLSPGRRQAIIWTNAGILLIGLLGTNFSEILIEIWIFSFKKMHLKMLSGKWRPFCLSLNVLTWCPPKSHPLLTLTGDK